MTEFVKINWSLINDRLEQCISSMIFKYFNNLSLLYMNNIFKPTGGNTTAIRTFLFKLSQSLRKINHRQKRLPYVAPSICNKLPYFLKTTENVNTFKQS